MYHHLLKIFDRIFNTFVANAISGGYLHKKAKGTQWEQNDSRYKRLKKSAQDNMWTVTAV
jgi:hypothetical protein